MTNITTRNSDALAAAWDDNRCEESSTSIRAATEAAALAAYHVAYTAARTAYDNAHAVSTANLVAAYAAASTAAIAADASAFGAPTNRTTAIEEVSRAIAAYTAANNDAFIAYNSTIAANNAALDAANTAACLAYYNAVRHIRPV